MTSSKDIIPSIKLIQDRSFIIAASDKRSKINHDFIICVVVLSRVTRPVVGVGHETVFRYIYQLFCHVFWK